MHIAGANKVMVGYGFAVRELIWPCGFRFPFLVCINGTLSDSVSAGVGSCAGDSWDDPTQQCRQSVCCRCSDGDKRFSPFVHHFVLPFFQWFPFWEALNFCHLILCASVSSFITMAGHKIYRHGISNYCDAFEKYIKFAKHTAQRESKQQREHDEDIKCGEKLWKTQFFHIKIRENAEWL